MRKPLRGTLQIGLAFGLCISAPLLLGQSPTSGAKQDSQHAGHRVKSATVDTGNGIQKGTKQAYGTTKHATKTGYHKTKKATKTGYKKTEHATKTGYHKTVRGTKKVGHTIEGKSEPQANHR